MEASDKNRNIARKAATEIAGFVEKRFAVKVKVAGFKLSAATLDGAVYFRSLSELVQSVSEVTKVRVYQSKDRQTIYIGHTKR